MPRHHLGYSLCRSYAELNSSMCHLRASRKLCAFDFYSYFVRIGVDMQKI
ncbi:hypothetical protein KP509_21G067200 [Ceratopteris richardii]|uniref:Uncharacterized protein n=1 Tax=Ceratopteris richardii TaxID=49495 RepID=A0A8T2SCS2_CERRI|nr:hypothetical protein KP509_21G067200 [Ceratopteris richardii]